MASPFLRVTYFAPFDRSYSLFAEDECVLPRRQFQFQTRVLCIVVFSYIFIINFDPSANLCMLLGKINPFWEYSKAES